MLRGTALDPVSIYKWPTLLKEMVIEASKGGVKLIWCEKQKQEESNESDNNAEFYIPDCVVTLCQPIYNQN